jgi:hypothetical protein
VLEKALSPRLLHLCQLQRAYSSCVIAVVGIVLSACRTVKYRMFDPTSALRLIRHPRTENKDQKSATFILF